MDNCRLVDRDSLNEDILYVLVDYHNRVPIDIDVGNLYGEMKC